MKTIVIFCAVCLFISFNYAQFKLVDIQQAEKFKSQEEYAEITLRAEQLFAVKVNEYRSKKNRGQLTLAQDAMVMALNHNAWMRQNKKFDHSEKSGTKFFTGSGLLKRLEYVRGARVFEMVGENIAMVSMEQDEAPTKEGLAELLAQKFFDVWLSSPPHRETMLNKVFKYHGISILKIGDEFYATHVFYG